MIDLIMLDRILSKIIFKELLFITYFRVSLAIVQLHVKIKILIGKNYSITQNLWFSSKHLTFIILLIIFEK